MKRTANDGKSMMTTLARLPECIDVPDYIDVAEGMFVGGLIDFSIAAAVAHQHVATESSIAGRKDD